MPRPITAATINQAVLTQRRTHPLATAATLTAEAGTFSETTRILPSTPQSRPGFCYTETVSELDSEEAREQFCSNWDQLQSAKQLQAMDLCPIEINGLTLKGEDCLALLSAQALAAYFQAVQQLKELSGSSSGFISSEDERVEIQKKAKNLEVKINALEEIIDLEGIKKVWHEKDKDQISKLFETAAGIFWKNAATQQKPSKSFLSDILPEAIFPPALLKQISAKLFAHIASALTPYSWNLEAQLDIGNFNVHKKSLPFDTGKDLPSGLINLASKSGRKTVKQYFDLLEQIDRNKGTQAVTVELDKKAYHGKPAMALLAERSVLSFTAMAQRYIHLHELLKAEATQNELLVALRTASIYQTCLFRNLAPLEELKFLKEALPQHSNFAFQPCIRKYWEKSTELRDQDPVAINAKLQTLLPQKIPVSTNEIWLAKKKIKDISQRLQDNPLCFSPEVKILQDKYWVFLRDSCDARDLDAIFRPRAYSNLDWAFSTQDSAPSSLIALAQGEKWLESAMFTATEILQTEKVYCDNLRGFSDFIASPLIISKIKDKDDIEFIYSIAKNLQSSRENSNLILGAMTLALGVKMTQKDFLAAGFSKDVESQLGMMPAENRRDALLKLCNLYNTTLFKETISDSQHFLNQSFAEKWDRFNKKYEKIIQHYQQCVPDSVDEQLQNMPYIPFQQRTGIYPLLWEALKKNVPPIFRDIIEITYLRIKTKTETAYS